MAKSLVPLDIPDYAAGRGISFLQVSALYQDTAEAITGAGGETLSPWVNCFIQCTATGGAAITNLDDFGKIWVEAVYRDGTTEYLIDPDTSPNYGESPFSLASIPSGTQVWLSLHADGKLKALSGGAGRPTVSYNPSASVSVATRERLPLDPTKVGQALRFYFQTIDLEEA